MSSSAPTSTDGERILMNTWNSSCAWRVRMVLAYKKLAYKYVTVSLVKTEDAIPEYVNQNPSGVPTLKEADGSTYTQSMAIMEYLEEMYPDTPSVLPKDPKQRALCRALTLEVVSGMQPLQNMAVAYLHIQCRHTWPKEKSGIMIGAKQNGCGEVTNLKRLQDVLIEKLWGLENLMSRCSGTHSCGNSFTIADAALVPQVHSAQHSFGVDISMFPVISRVVETLKKEECVTSTEPDVCPDAVASGPVPFSVVAVPGWKRAD